MSVQLRMFDPMTCEDSEWLIRQCRPDVVFGEQVASAAGRAWFDLVSTDLEGLGYACGAHDLCAASVGAPHIRQRLFWVADCDQTGLRGQRRTGLPEDGHPPSWNNADGRGEAGGMEKSRPQSEGRGVSRSDQSVGAGQLDAPDQSGGSSRVGFWSALEWLPCRDGKYRPTQSGLFPLVARLPKGVGRSGDSRGEVDADATTEARVMRLRGYGNAIVPEVAAEFIASYCDARVV